MSAHTPPHVSTHTTPCQHTHSTIPPDELQELNELFTSIDEEGTGTITYEQLRRSLEMAGCQVWCGGVVYV